MANQNLGEGFFAKGVYGRANKAAKITVKHFVKRSWNSSLKGNVKNLSRQSKKLNRGLNSVSTSRRTHAMLYGILKRELNSRAKTRGQSHKDIDVHHCRLRAGTLYLDWRFWRMLDRRTHSICKDNPTMARELGILCASGKSNEAPQDSITAALRTIMRLPPLLAKAELKLLMQSPDFVPFSML